MSNDDGDFFGYDCVPVGALAYIKNKNEFMRCRIIKSNPMTFCVSVQRSDGLIIDDVYPVNNNDFYWNGELDLDGAIVPLIAEARKYSLDEPELKEADPNSVIALPYCELPNAAPIVTTYNKGTFIPITKSGECDVCKQETEYRCKECMRTFYCSRKCQKHGWKGHTNFCSYLKSGYAKSTTTTSTIPYASNIQVVDCSYHLIDNSAVELSNGSVRVGKRSSRGDSGSQYNNFVHDAIDMGISANNIRSDAAGDVEMGNAGGAQLTAAAVAEHTKATGDVSRNRSYRYEANNHSSEEDDDDNEDRVNNSVKIYPEAKRTYGPDLPPSYSASTQTTQYDQGCIGQNCNMSHPNQQCLLCHRDWSVHGGKDAKSSHSCVELGQEVGSFIISGGISYPSTDPAAAASAVKQHQAPPGINTDPVNIDSMVAELLEVVGYSKSEEEVKAALRKANWNKDQACMALFEY